MKLLTTEKASLNLTAQEALVYAAKNDTDCAIRMEAALQITDISLLESLVQFLRGELKEDSSETAADILMSIYRKWSNIQTDIFVNGHTDDHNDYEDCTNGWCDGHHHDYHTDY